MKLGKLPYAGAMLAAMLAMVSPAHADLRANLFAVGGPMQVRTTGIVRFGSVVTANTSLNAIWASASYQIDCSDPKIRPPLSGKAGWSDNGVVGPRSITVTVPAGYVPAEKELPGWQGVMGGSYVSCVYKHWGAAKTHMLPITSGGVSFPVGGDGWELEESIPFGMIKPGTSDFGGICIM